MHTANITLWLGGDSGQTVQKYKVTASEIAVLRAIHGSDSVRDVEFVDVMTRSDRAEQERLHRVYGRPLGDGAFRSDAVAALFPGVAARMFDRLEELELPEDCITRLTPATARVPATPAPVAATAPETEVPAAPVALETLTKVKLLQIASTTGVDVSENDTKAVIIAAIRAAAAAAEAAPVPEDEDDDNDGVEDMPDSAMFE